MKSLRTCSNIVLMTFIIGISHSYAQMQCVCHSKQPAMRRMHEQIGIKDCGNCHKKDEDLMSKKTEKDSSVKANLAKRFRDDTFCAPCHDSQGSVKKGIQDRTTNMAISGTLYCPKDRMKFSPDSRFCSKCGGALLNINELMAQSRKTPSNGICVECHMTEEVQQIKRHAIFNNEKLKQCLDCHQGHNDCGSCHH